MFEDHNPLSYLDIDTDGAVATWPAGADEFNRNYTMASLGDEAMQIYCDGGWVTSNKGRDPKSKGIFGIGAEEVEQPGNRVLFFGEENDNLEPEYMIFTGPEFYSDDLADISGETIDRNSVEDGAVAIVREDDNGYHLEHAESPEDMEDCVAFGYAEAFDNGFPLITVENARDAYMAMGYDEEFQDDLDKAHSHIHKRINERGQEVEEEHIKDEWWIRPSYKDEGDRRSHYGLHEALAQKYEEETGGLPDSWDKNREHNAFYPEDLENIAGRDDELGAMAQNILDLNDAKSEAEEAEREDAREDLLTGLLAENWYDSIVEPSARMRDKVEEHGEEYYGVHDIHDLFNMDMQSTKFDNPNLSDSKKLSVVVDVAEKEFDNVAVYGIPWDKDVDGKEQPMKAGTELREVFPVYEDLIPEEDLPPVKGESIMFGTPFRPVMTLSDQPVEVEGDEVIDLSETLL